MSSASARRRSDIRAGSVAAAAYELGIGETTVRQHLSGLYGRTGCVNAAQAAYWLGVGAATIAADPAARVDQLWYEGTSVKDSATALSKK